ncbi:GNAT family N-acetyltransferase [Streptomyces sp. NPDC091280]|uniref:GNAT family N-acetyltransferase n=1 Tax=unclassified Streptomyces TaxID=2593676 RepID=UPI00380FDD17
MLEVHPCTADDTADLDELLAASHREHLGRYPELAGSYRAGVDPGARFLLARSNGADGADALGCVAVQPLAVLGVPPGAYEVKRVYVRAGARRLGVGSALMAAAETLSAGLGTRVLYLETGVRHTAAQGLFRSRGFRPVPPYPPYLDDPFALCFSKRLEPRAPA